MLEHIAIVLAGDYTPPATPTNTATVAPVHHDNNRGGVLRPGRLGRAWQGSSYYFNRPEYYGAAGLWGDDSFLSVNIAPAIIPSLISVDSPVLCPEEDQAVIVDGQIVCEQPSYVLRTRPAFYQGPGWLRGRFLGRRH